MVNVIFLFYLFFVFVFFKKMMSNLTENEDFLKFAEKFAELPLNYVPGTLDKFYFHLFWVKPIPKDISQTYILDCLSLLNGAYIDDASKKLILSPKIHHGHFEIEKVAAIEPVENMVYFSFPVEYLKVVKCTPGNEWLQSMKDYHMPESNTGKFSGVTGYCDTRTLQLLEEFNKEFLNSVGYIDDCMVLETHFEDDGEKWCCWNYHEPPKAKFALNYWRDTFTWHDHWEEPMYKRDYLERFPYVFMFDPPL